jgi:hypothetical protein
MKPTLVTHSIDTSADARAFALLGERPLVTLVDRNDATASLSVRLWRSGGAWLAIVDDGAALLDRVRMGLSPGFLVHHDAATPTISGDVDVRILGPAQDHARASADHEHPFGLARAVLVEVKPRALALEPTIEGQTVGAVPRT